LTWGVGEQCGRSQHGAECKRANGPRAAPIRSFALTALLDALGGDLSGGEIRCGIPSTQPTTWHSRGKPSTEATLCCPRCSWACLVLALSVDGILLPVQPALSAAVLVGRPTRRPAWRGHSCVGRAALAGQREHPSVIFCRVVSACFSVCRNFDPRPSEEC
jgi:hypothetical protein